MSHNKVCSQLNVPFSWELKPGVSKLTREECSIDIGHITLNLPPPPRLSKSGRFCVHDLQGVLPPCQLQPPPPRSSARKGNVIFNKQEDPFVAAYRKCTECSMNGKLGTDDKNDACRTRTKKNMFTLSCKYSCTVSSDNSVVKVSQRSKKKTREEHNKKTGKSQNSLEQTDAKCHRES